ncbi:MAG: hypothetical protein ACAH65_04465, partial [Chloroflexota bacterium]
AASEPDVAAVAACDAAGLVALPGERLSRAVGGLTEADLARAEVFTLDDLGEDAPVATEPLNGEETNGTENGDEPRRRRRRGGRGRGRGRGRADEGQPDEAGDVVAPALGSPASAAPAPRRAASRGPAREEDDLDVARPRAPRATPFGSVWDSQLGTPTASSAASRPPVTDDEDFDEPEIPEYLIAEQRRGARGAGGGGGGGGRGARGGRSAYQSAMDRERYGGGRGGGGINRYPDVSGRTGQAAPPPRDDRGRGRVDRPAAPVARSSDEPWSDVPPELEAMLRAQVAQKPASPRLMPTDVEPLATSVVEIDGSAEDDAVTAAPARKPRTTRKPSAAKATVDASDVSDLASEGASETTVAKAPAKPRATRKTASSATTADKAPAKPRATRKPATASATTTDADSAEAAPKRRTTRKTAAPAEPV